MSVWVTEGSPPTSPASGLSGPHSLEGSTSDMPRRELQEPSVIWSKRGDRFELVSVLKSTHRHVESYNVDGATCVCVFCFVFKPGGSIPMCLWSLGKFLKGYTGNCL